MPGSKIFSIATTGCNWLCHYCQNFDISQRRKIEGLSMTPESVVKMTKRYGCQGLAYTYNEPTIFMEFAHDIGVQARKEGLVNLFVSNGYGTPDSVSMMNDFLDCITVDIKGSGETNFVRKYIGIQNADPIFQTLSEIHDRTKIHIEITDLVVPEVGDDLGAAKNLSQWVYDNLGPDTPIHFLRFHPDYKMANLPWTPVKTLENCHAVAKAVGLNYVYIGNVPGHPLEHTYCPQCGNVAVERMGFDITRWHLNDRNQCKHCGNQIPIIGQLSKSVNEDRFMSVTM
jgi:pyruvate formate lyase activating enzyme